MSDDEDEEEVIDNKNLEDTRNKSKLPYFKKENDNNIATPSQNNNKKHDVDSKNFFNIFF